MTYSREEYDWIEAEWAFHLHGRSAFLSVDDFQKIKEWEGHSIPPDLIVSAMKRYFERRLKKKDPSHSYLSDTFNRISIKFSN